MGVVHKLKKEVTDFIIDQKTQQPSLSVRKLAELTTKTFQTKISKSSVSKVLKNANLSSSVGRRPKSKRPPKKFKIPKEKKEQIHARLPDLPEKKKPAPAKEEKPPASKKPPAEGPTPDTKRKKSAWRPIIVDEKSYREPASAAPQDREPGDKAKASRTPPERERPQIEGKPQFSDFLKKKREDIKRHTVEEFPYMGFAVFQAIQRQLSDENFFGQLVRRYQHQPMGPHFESLVNLLLYYRTIKEYAGRDEKVKNLDGLCRLCGLRDNPGEELLDALGKDLAAPAELVNAYMQKLSELTTGIFSYRFLRKDGPGFYIGSNWASLKKDLPKFSEPVPVNSALDALSKKVVSNREMILVKHVPDETWASGAAEGLVGFCENRPGQRVTDISVLDGRGEDVASFSAIPHIRRLFAVLLWPSQKAFDAVSRTIKWAVRKPCYIEELDRAVVFAETRADLSAHLGENQPELRVLTIWPEIKASGQFEEDPAVSILTNNDRAAAEDIITSVCLRWPVWDASSVQKNDKKDTDRPGGKDRADERELWDRDSEIVDFPGLLSHFSKTLALLALSHVPEQAPQAGLADFISTICRLRGSITEKNQHKVIKIKNLEKINPRDPLRNIIRYLNESGITILDDYKLLITCNL